MTNPETCLHNVITTKVADKFESGIYCVSCGTDLTDPKMRVGKNYEYDIDHEIWVHKPKKKD